MGMLMRRHREDVPVVDSSELADSAAGEDTTEGTSDGVEDTTGSEEAQGESEVQEEATDGSSEPTPVDAPKRNASRSDWLAYLGLSETDPRTRDELAESVLGPKE